MEIWAAVFRLPELGPDRLRKPEKAERSISNKERGESKKKKGFLCFTG